ncbi:GMC oxidoreductase [Streptomyces sp. NPDC047197]|uniref:GMC oxidoreductase n=1 Tax=Streptomyces sp. NPDC047197 TaxID=3155477 RepID=UPI0033E3EFBD
MSVQKSTGTTESTEAVDVVIIGSGPTGATYAHQIHQAHPSAGVLVVEAGPALTDPPGLHLTAVADADEHDRARVAAQGPFQHPYGIATASAIAHNQSREERGRALVTRPGMFPVGSGDLTGDGLPAAQQSCNVGGMGALWFGASPRPGDAERIDCVDPEGLDEAYAIAERLLQVSGTQFSDSAFAAHLERVLGEELDEGRAQDRRVRAMPMAAVRSGNQVRRSGTDVILRELPTGPGAGVELRADTLCEKVLVEDGRAVGVRLRDRATGAVHVVRADYVVVAADPLRTPQLLFASGVRPQALGRYLNEHPQVSVIAEVHGFGGAEGGDGGVGGAGGDGGSGGEGGSGGSGASEAPSGVTWIPYEGERYPFHCMLTRIDPATVAQSADSGRAGRPLVSVHLFTSQEPRVDNRLEFSDTERDWIGMPAMTIHHTLDDGDRATLAEAEAEALRLSKVLGRPADGETPWILPSGSSLHYQGTVRMGAVDDGTSVCDPSSRVWGVDNLYVAGNGVIPTRTACNPTLTSVALSVLGARDIARRIRLRPGTADAAQAPEARTTRAQAPGAQAARTTRASETRMRDEGDHA